MRVNKSRFSIFYIFYYIKVLIIRIRQVNRAVYDYITSFEIFKQPIILTPNDCFIKVRKEKFDGSYITNDDEDEVIQNINYSINVEETLYDKENYKKTLEESDNVLETSWKRRIMIDHTPRGNIIMYYDPYKLAFCYYSDISSFPYNLLNASAMKYCIQYYCRDLFMDNQETPKDNETKLIKIHFEDKEKIDESTEEGKKKKETMDILKDAPFLKRKQAKDDKKESNETKKTKETKDGVSGSEQPKDDRLPYRNKFVYMGKTTNFQLLNKQPIIHKMNGFSTDLLKPIAEETELQNQVMSWRDYKNKTKA